MGCPQGFNPPVHWNELYDNKLWWLPDWGMDKPENRKKYYTLDDLKEAAGKAARHRMRGAVPRPGLGYTICLQDLG